MLRPDPFLEVRVRRATPAPGVTALCAGYENGKWRAEQLAAHLMTWLPEFALKHSEFEAIGGHNAAVMLARAARSVYKSKKYEGRGELGELILHAVVRQVFDTVPAIAKFFYKDGANETVKGFDLVHVVALQDALELWLGEAKFFDDIGAAIREVLKDLDRHLKRDYLRGEFAAVTNKIDDTWPHAQKLKKLLHENTSLDQIFAATCIPVLLTYNSDAVSSHRKICDEYKAAFEEEVLKHRDTFAAQKLPTKTRIELLLVPLGSKKQLVDKFDEQLRRWQRIAP